MSVKPKRKRPTGTSLIAQPELLVPSVAATEDTPDIAAEKESASAPNIEIEVKPTELQSVEAVPVARSSQKVSVERIKKSIQLDPGVAEALETHILMLHAKYRVPKNRVVDAIITVGLASLDQVEMKLK